MDGVKDGEKSSEIGVHRVMGLVAPFFEKNKFGDNMKIMWEEQLVGPPIDYITPVNVP